MRRAVITGMGIVSSLGDSLAEVLDSLRHGRSGIRYHKPYKELGLRAQIGAFTKIKPKQPVSETVEYVTWDYSERLVLDRESETLEHIQNIGSGCVVSRKYYVQGGIEELLNDIDADDLFGEIEGNPDDVVFLSSGGRWMADYKVPNVVDESVAFDYEVQLNHYSINAELQGIKLDGMLLVKLDLAPEIAAALVDRIEDMSSKELHDLAKTIAKVNLPGMRVLPIVVPPNPSLRQQILESGNQFWNDYILQGVVPNQRKELLPVTELTTEKISKFQLQYAAAKAGINQLNLIASEAENAIAGLLVGVDFKDKVFPESLVAIKEKSLDKTLVIQEALLRGATEEELQADKKSYSVDALLDEIKRLGGDVTSSSLHDKSSDAKKAEAFLIAKNVPVDDFRQEGVSLRVSTKKADKEAMAALEAYALDVMKPLVGDDEKDNAFANFGSDEDMEVFENEFGIGSDNEALDDSFEQSKVSDANTTQFPRFKGASLR